MATALVSALTGIPVRSDVAMTGEITLRGRVLPIGGLREKSLAALRARIYTVIAPEQNKKDLEEIPKHIRRRLDFQFVKHMDEVLKLALKRDPAAHRASGSKEPGSESDRTKAESGKKSAGQRRPRRPELTVTRQR